MDPCSERIVQEVMALAELVAVQTSKTFQPLRVTVERNRDAPLTDDDLPSLVVFADPERIDYILTGQDDYDITLTFQGTILGRAGDAAKFANRLRADLHAALMEDRTLGGIASDLRPAELSDRLEAPIVSADIEGFMVSYTVHYATVENDPYTFV